MSTSASPSSPAAPPMRHPGLPSSFSRLLRLIRKEVLSILRDRRTILTLILMPLLLYPLLAIAFQQFVLGGAAVASGTVYRIGYLSQDDRDKIHPLLVELGQKLLPSSREGDTSQAGPIKLAPLTVNDAITDLLTSRVDVVLEPRTPMPADTDHPLDWDWELRYRPNSSYSREAVAYLQRVTAAANAHLLSQLLQVKGITQRADPFRLIPTPLEKESVAAGGSSLIVLLPLILILMTITGAVYPSIDLTAGERERGTLETLVAAPIPRFSLLFAKYVAVLTVAVLTAVTNLGTMTVTLMVIPLGQVLGTGGLTVVTVAEVFGLMLLFAAFFSAVLLLLTSFARSFKEAQAYLIPLMLASLLPGMLPLLLPDLSLDGPGAVAPLLNIVLLARDLLARQASTVTAVVVVLSTLLYALAAIAVAARLFGAEGVLYSDQSGWGDLLRRPRQPQASPTSSAALLCLALLFPLSFAVNGLLAQVSGPLPADQPPRDPSLDPPGSGDRGLPVVLPPSPLPAAPLPGPPPTPPRPLPRSVRLPWFVANALAAPALPGWMGGFAHIYYLNRFQIAYDAPPFPGTSPLSAAPGAQPAPPPAPGSRLAQLMILRGLATVALFAAVPWLFAAARRVRPTTGFRLRPAALVVFAGVVLLGVSLWVFDYQLTLLVRQLGLNTLQPKLRDLLQAELRSWRALGSPLLPLLVLALIPAVCEELTFRGYLFSGLRTVLSPAKTIVATALLFGLFHIVLGNMLLLERFMASTLMGLVLGWVCWRSGSVFPGMLLHAGHNSLIVLLAYYEPQLKQAGWLNDKGELPSIGLAVAVLGGAALIAALGAGLVWRARTPAEREPPGSQS